MFGLTFGMQGGPKKTPLRGGGFYSYQPLGCCLDLRDVGLYLRYACINRRDVCLNIWHLYSVVFIVDCKVYEFNLVFTSVLLCLCVVI